MRVFCPSCGSENEGPVGGRVTCQACSSSFEIPREAQSTAVASAPPSVTSFGGAAPLQPKVFPLPPPRGAQRSGGYNSLAVTSLVCGLLFCVPFVTPLTAVITGFIALQQLNAGLGPPGGRLMAYAGITLGLGTLVLTALMIIGILAN